jgi:hypothetical protein
MVTYNLVLGVLAYEVVLLIWVPQFAFVQMQEHSNYEIWRMTVVFLKQ